MVRQFQAFPSLLRRRAFHLEGFFLNRVVGVVPEPPAEAFVVRVTRKLALGLEVISEIPRGSGSRRPPWIAPCSLASLQIAATPKIARTFASMLLR
jgi:hypothetical protein